VNFVSINNAFAKMVSIHGKHYKFYFIFAMFSRNAVLPALDVAQMVSESLNPFERKLHFSHTT
jgi:hypothetical protein